MTTSGPHSEPRPSVTRSKTMELELVGLDEYRLVGRLTDTSRHGDYGDVQNSTLEAVIHDFIIEGVVRGRDLIITELGVRAETHPYRQCPAIVPSCQALVGKSLASGWRRAVLDTLGATAGCTHVTTLLVGLAEARTMAFFLQMNAAQAYNQDTRADGRWTAVGLDLTPSIVDACHVLTHSGQVVQSARTVRSAIAPPEGS
jgi:hypothetical protein